MSKFFGYPEFDANGEEILCTYDNEYSEMLMDVRVYRMAAGVAWQTGVGVTIGGKVSLGVHYYALGTQDIESGKSGMFDDWADKLAGEFEEGKINPSMMVLRLGYHF